MHVQFCVTFHPILVLLHKRARARTNTFKMIKFCGLISSETIYFYRCSVCEMSMDGVLDWIDHRCVHSILAGYLLLLRYAVETIVIAMHSNKKMATVKWFHMCDSSM